MIVKKRIENGKVFLSVCDKELIGNVFLEDDKLLDLKSSFYDGEEVNDKNLEKTILSSYFITIIGENSIKALLNLGLLDVKSIKKIKGIPYSLLLREI